MSNELTIPGTNPTPLEIRMDSKKYPRLFRYTKDDAVARMSKVVTMAMVYRGQTFDTAGVVTIASALVDELLAEERYGAKNLSFEEIERAIKKAVLDEDIYICVATLYRAVVDWCKGEGAKIQQEARELKRRQDNEALKNSVIAPMLTAYTGEFLTNNKIK